MQNITQYKQFAMSQEFKELLDNPKTIVNFVKMTNEKGFSIRSNQARGFKASDLFNHGGKRQ